MFFKLQHTRRLNQGQPPLPPPALQHLTMLSEAAGSCGACCVTIWRPWGRLACLGNAWPVTCAPQRGYLSLAKLPSPRALMPPPQKWLLPPRPTRTHHITPPDLGYMKTLKLQTLPACLHKAPLCLLPLPVLQTLPFSLQLLPVSHWAFPVTLSLVPVKNLMLPLPFCLLLPVNKLPLPVSLSLLPITCPMLPFTLRRPPINSPLLPVRPCPQGVACQNRPALICRLVLAQTLLSLMIKACIQAP